MSTSARKRDPAASPVRGAAAEPSHGAVQLGWAVLTSPSTTAGLTLALAGLLAAASAVVQGGDVGTLLTDHSFATTRVVESLELRDAFTAWPVQLVVLLLVLNLIGVLLRHVVLPGRAAAARPSLAAGPRVAVAEASLPDDAVEVRRRLEPHVGTLRELGAGRWAGRKGAWEASWVLVGAGLVGLAAAAIVAHTTTFEARVELVPGSRNATVVTEVLDGDIWIPRAPLGFACDAADPADLTRRRVCRVPTREGAEEVVLAAGTSASAAGLTVTPTRERPVPVLFEDDLGPTLLVRRGGSDAPPERLETRAGTAYQLQNGPELTAFFGPDGPLVVARDEGKPPVLLVPALRDAAGPAPGDVWLSAVPRWRLSLHAQTHPERTLQWTGLGLLLLGLLGLALIPDLRVSCLAEGDATVVRVRSFNRPGRPAAVLASVIEARR